ncbi:MAG: MerR family transcriptional regulator [Oscillospiraceae bacterium]|nr:MerR family transcriptional regulator [Oscillospiraceae bacterium]
MENMFKIGEIAQIFDISVRALRLYDKMSLLQPEYIDPDTSYRYYTDKQINKLKVIIGLRKVNFSIAQIQDILNPNLSYEQLIRIMQLKKVENEKIIDKIKYNNELIDDMIEVSALTKKADVINMITQEERDIILSKIACLENPKFESALLEILWL